MAGTANLLLAALYLVIDVLRVWGGAPFRYPGQPTLHHLTSYHHCYCVLLLLLLLLRDELNHGVCG